MHVVISGSSGLVGTALARHLRAHGHSVTALVRRAPAPGEIAWNPQDGVLAPGALDGVDAVVNLAGAGIGDHRWTAAYRKVLRDSRLRSTELLATTIAACANPPATMLSASAVGYYGPRGDEVIDESCGPGDDFLARLCVDWEAATRPAEAAGARVAHLRSGVVLSRDGGALRKQLPLFRLGLGGRFGSGRQWQSWISVDDEVGAIAHLLDAPVHGPVDLTAPAPVTNREFTATLGRVLRRPAILPVPSFAPKLLLGADLATALLLTGQRVLPAVLQSSGYAFRHPSLETALRAVLDR